MFSLGSSGVWRKRGGEGLFLWVDYRASVMPLEMPISPPPLDPSLPSKSTSYSLAEPSSSLRRGKGALLLWRTTKRGSEQEARGRDKFDLCPSSPSFSLLLLLPRRPRLVFFRSGWREKRFPLSSFLASQSVPFPQRMIHFSAVRSGPEFYSEKQNGMVFFSPAGKNKEKAPNI